MEWFAERFTHDRHAAGVREPAARYEARYALPVRIMALVLVQFAPVVRTQGSQPPMREPSVRTWAACLLRNVEVARRWFPLWFPRYRGLRVATGPLRPATHDHMKTTMSAAQGLAGC